MALQMKPNSKWFYGRIMINGVKKSVNLGIEIKGKRPRTLREEGDALFERARGQAQEKLKKAQIDSKQKKAAVEILQTIHEARTGERAGSIPLRATKEHQGMFEAWKSLPKKRKPSERYVKQIKSLFERFIAFLESEYPQKKIREMSDVRSHLATDFMNSVEKRGVSGKTYNNELIALRSAFDALAKEAALFENPFQGIPTKEENTAFRKPYDIDELSRIVEVASGTKHAFIRPIILTGICTAMRRGDCCLFSPQSVDFNRKFIKVKTGKTGKIAQIPLFPLLENELLKHSPSKNGEYLFPKQAEMYLKNPDGITWRVKKVLKEAGYYDAKSGDSTPAGHVANTHAVREKGLRAASIRDFHSFRVSWVTLALTSGVDLELVKMVTGHQTVDIVLKHYFQPGRDYFKANLQSKMPGLLVGVATETELEQKIHGLIKLTNKLKGKANLETKERILEGLRGLLHDSPDLESKNVAQLLRQA